MIFLEHTISLWETRSDGQVSELSAQRVGGLIVRAVLHTFVWHRVTER
ncbi:hypothetical protein SUDANB95_00571 [Actinosynnema sp. ALI-1.44]